MKHKRHFKPIWLNAIVILVEFLVFNNKAVATSEHNSSSYEVLLSASLS